MVCARLWPLSEPSLESQANSLSPLSHHARSPSYLGNCNVHSVCGDLLQRLLLPSCPLSCPLLIRPPGSMPRTQRLWDRSSEFFGIYPLLTMVSSIYTLMSEYCPCPHGALQSPATYHVFSMLQPEHSAPAQGRELARALPLAVGWCSLLKL